MKEYIKDYEVKSILGKGDMATVYLAENRKSKNLVAIKVLNGEYANDEKIRNFFFSEGKCLLEMSHPNIVEVRELIDDEGLAAFVMEYIEGNTLGEFLEKKGRLSDSEIRDLMNQMLDVLVYIHGKNVAHKDIKPSNFILGINGVVKLIDFGIAKNHFWDPLEANLEDISWLMGSPMYMSPEQAMDIKDITAKSDIYSLGVVLWQMVKGAKPYDADTLSLFEILQKIVTEPLEETNTSWDNLIKTATRKSPDQRFDSCTQFKEALNSIQIYHVDFSNTELIGNLNARDSMLINRMVEEGVPGYRLSSDEVYFAQDENMKYGLIDRNGMWIIDPVYDSIDFFDSRGFSRARQNDKFGIIDNKGRWVIDPIYDDIASSDLDGFRRVMLNGKMGVIDLSGKWILKPDFDIIHPVDKEGFRKAVYNGKTGFIDIKGDWKVEPIFDSLDFYDNLGFCRATFDGRIGFIDREGHWLIQPNFEDSDYFDSEGMSRSSIKGKTGYIDRKGDWVVAPNFDDLSSYDEMGFSKASSNGKVGLIDRSGKWVIKPVFNKIENYDGTRVPFLFFG
jgi:serine/threonine protein kinase